MGFLKGPFLELYEVLHVSDHTYADDMQLHITVLPNDYNPLESLGECIQQVDEPEFPPPQF